MKKSKDEIIDAGPEPTDEELMARRKAALAEYGIVDQRAIPSTTDQATDDDVTDEA